MRILANAAYSVVDTVFKQYPQLTQYFGWLNTPRCGYNFSRLAQYGVPIACDNSAYSAFCERRYLNMLHRISVPVLWVTVPDIVGNAEKTQQLWEQWYEMVCYPRAYVGQDGCENRVLPWDQFDCFFIGGTTDWKLSQSAADVAKAAKKKGKYIHMGRVNSRKRLRYAYELGCDSVDGTGYSQFSRKELLKGLYYIDALVCQLRLLNF